MCEFKGSSGAPGGWDNGVRHSNDVLQAHANVKNNKYKTLEIIIDLPFRFPINNIISQGRVWTHKAFAPAIIGMSCQIHADFLRLLWVLAHK